MPSPPNKYRRLAVDLDPEDFDRIKQLAAEKGISMKDVAVSCLRACGVLPEQRPKWTPDVEVDAEAA